MWARVLLGLLVAILAGAAIGHDGPLFWRLLVIAAGVAAWRIHG